jgi:hypothetical protein
MSDLFAVRDKNGGVRPDSKPIIYNYRDSGTDLYQRYLLRDIDPHLCSRMFNPTIVDGIVYFEPAFPTQFFSRLCSEEDPVANLTAAKLESFILDVLNAGPGLVCLGAGVVILNTITEPWGLPKTTGVCLVGPDDFQVPVRIPDMLKRFRQCLGGALQDGWWSWADFICNLPPVLANMRAALRRVESSPSIDDDKKSRLGWINILMMIVDQHVLADNAKDIPFWSGWDADVLKNDPLDKLINSWNRLQIPAHPRAESDVLKIFELSGDSS